MNDNLRRGAAGLPNAIAAALYIETQIEATEVKKRTPVWNPARSVPRGHAPGTLRASVHVVGPIREGRTVYTMIACGGKLAPYAIYVHETPPEEAYHATGQWKFLESVILESRPFMGARVARRLGLSMEQIIKGSSTWEDSNGRLHDTQTGKFVPGE